MHMPFSLYVELEQNSGLPPGRLGLREILGTEFNRSKPNVASLRCQFCQRFSVRYFFARREKELSEMVELFILHEFNGYRGILADQGLMLGELLHEDGGYFVGIDRLPIRLVQ